jgi:hypothetical protein
MAISLPGAASLELPWVSAAAFLCAGSLACSSDENGRRPMQPDRMQADAPGAMSQGGSTAQPIPDDLPPIVGPLPAVGSMEDGGTACARPPLPAFAALPSIPALPDPFMDASGSRIRSRAQWACRRAEISAQIQAYELGAKPPRPSIVEASFDGTQISVTVGEPDNTLQLSASIARPAGAPEGAIPAVIAIDNNSLDTSVFTERGVATITFSTAQLAPRFPTRGVGPFWQLHGTAHRAGAMIGWAWGVSRIIDALEQTPQANVDVSRLAVTGCSYAGKVALFSGAFDERIALTIAQESGGGGSASWRISQEQTAKILAANPSASQGEQVESLANAQGVAWYRQSLREFNSEPDRLPFDHHMLMGMVAPRALFVVDNSSMIYLGDESSYTDSVAAHEIWQGLGVPDRRGASQVGGHEHCAFPASQRAELVAFVDKFMIADDEADTNVLRSDRIVPDSARWMPWTTPALE